MEGGQRLKVMVQLEEYGFNLSMIYYKNWWVNYMYVFL